MCVLRRPRLREFESLGGMWDCLRAWDFPTERVLSRTPLIIRTVDQIKKKNQNPKLSNSLNRSLRSTHTQDLLPTTQHLHTHEPTHPHTQEEE